MTDLVASKEEVKKVIRSLLISAPNGLTLSMLEKDYYAVTHEPFPHRKFGFFSAGDFARSLTDILYVTVKHNQALFYGIADEKTNHILEMVKKQKKPKRYNRMFPEGSPKRKTGFKPFSFRSLNQFPTAALRTAVHKLVNAHPDGFPVSRLPEMYKETNGFDLPSDTVSKIPDMIFGMPDVARLEFGRCDSSGNNLYIFPPKSPLDYKALVSGKVKLKETVPRSHKVQPRCFGPTGGKSEEKTNQNTHVSLITKLLNDVSEVSSPLPPSKSSAVVSVSTVSPLTSSVKPTLTTSSSEAKQTSAKSCDTGGLVKNSESFLEKASPANLNSALDSIDAIFAHTTPPKCKELQNEVIELLNDNRMGLHAAKMPLKYKEKFDKEFNLSRIGYFSTIEFMSTLTDQVSICRPTETSDWILCLRKYDNKNCNKAGSSKKISGSFTKVEKHLKTLLERFPEGVNFSSLAQIYEIQFGKSFPLEELGFSSLEQFIVKLLDRLACVDGKLVLHSASEVFIEKEDNTPTVPIDAVGSGVCYNSPVTPTKEWDYFDIFISHVNSPSSFMIQVIGTETTVALDELMDQLEKCYSQQEGQFYRMPVHLIHVGQICVTIYHGDKNWNRAIVVKEPECGFVEVLYVDYGDVASVSVHSLFLLKTVFQVLPAQMIPARLSHLQPTDMDKWHPDTRRVMLEMCRDKSLVALVTDVDAHGVLSLLVCDTKQSDTVDIYLNDVLIEKGIAIYVDDNSTAVERQAIKDALNSFQNTVEVSTAYKPVEPAVPCTESRTATSTNMLPSNDDPPPYELHAPPVDIFNPPGSYPKAEESMGPFVGKCSGKVFNEAECIMSRYVTQQPGSQQCNCNTRNLQDTLVFHVIYYEGNMFLTSAEISSIFRPDCEDILLPMLIMKELHFEELVLANDVKHARLFTELERHKVKGAVVKGVLKQFVTLYRVCDVPSMIVDIGYPEKTDILNFFMKILKQDKRKMFESDTKKTAPPCVSDTEVAGPSHSSLTSSQPIKSQKPGYMTTSHSRFGESESSSLAKTKQTLQSESPRKSSSCDEKSEVDELTDFKSFIKKTGVDILEALKHNMTEKREAFLNELVTNPSTELIKKLEDIFLRIKLVENVLEGKKTSSKHTVNKVVTSDLQEPISTTCVISKPIVGSSKTSIGQIPSSSFDECLGVIPPSQVNPVTNIFAAMSLSNTGRSGLKISSPPFKPQQRLQTLHDPLAPPTVTVAPRMSTFTPQIQSNPFYYCPPNSGYAPEPHLQNMTQQTPFPVLLSQSQTLSAPPGTPIQQYNPVWMQSHFTSNNV